MSINDVPAPPNPFPKKLHVLTLEAGTPLHHIGMKDYAGNSFNPSADAQARFSPIFHQGKVVPVWYGAGTAEAAFHETLFHDVHQKRARFKAIPIKRASVRNHGQWIPTRDLKVVSLHARSIANLNVTTDQLTATDSKYYRQTARWAELIHQTYDDVDGIRWTSYRADPDLAFMLFGTRVRSDELRLAPKSVESAIVNGNPIFDTFLACGTAVGYRVNLKEACDARRSLHCDTARYE